MKFQIEQIALAPAVAGRPAARQLLEALGLTTWVEDTVCATGTVFGEPGSNVAELAFNYESFGGDKPLELEVLQYLRGPNWVGHATPTVSHLGMHCTAEELERWRTRMAELGYCVAQEVFTDSHTNPAIKDSRRYQYVIFDTRAVLGTDLKFIVRRAVEA